MNLYFICAHDNDGESLNLFVRAETPAEAFEAWKATDFCSGWACCFEGVLSSEPPEDATCEDARIFLVPESNLAGPIRWHTPDGVNVVAHVNPI
ncbi:hypothetical protein SAMN05216358_0094 [Rhizobium sp. AN5]|uniref:hypothetical protein n=1 Tax=Rhizobium sp. AN5 TaxID=1855304 RepID=UPI000BD20323|nr:hypothetical protein [Rhizobium sp. AN5]SOC90075.1 hypothetical protein SAMN05216358_0094 [Rhizobium sp. AN5]